MKRLNESHLVVKEIDPEEIKEKSKKYKNHIETLKGILKKFDDDIIDLSLIEQEVENKMNKKDFRESFYVLMAEGYIFKPDSKSVKVLKT